MQYIQDSNLKLELENFSGEPQFLLRKVKEEKLDICNFSLLEIVNQYLNWLLNFRGDINIAADFLLISSNLIFLKSLVLLPKRETAQEEEEEDLGQLLEQKIWEYKQIKDIAKQMRFKEESQSLFFSRPEIKNQQTVEQNIEQADAIEQKADIKNLIAAFAQISSLVSGKEVKIAKERWSVRDKIFQILNWLKQKTLFPLKKLFQSAENKLEMITIFLATLELIKTNQITVQQKEAFGEIWITAKKELV